MPASALLAASEVDFPSGTRGFSPSHPLLVCKAQTFSSFEYYSPICGGVPPTSVFLFGWIQIKIIQMIDDLPLISTLKSPLLCDPFPTNVTLTFALRNFSCLLIFLPRFLPLLTHRWLVAHITSLLLGVLLLSSKLHFSLRDGISCQSLYFHLLAIFSCSEARSITLFLREPSLGFLG